MRFESGVTSVSWIPSAAISGVTKAPFELGVTHYDDPPPETLGDLDAVVGPDGARFANELRGWITVEDGRIVDHGQAGRGWISNSKVKLGGMVVYVEATALPDLRPTPEVGRRLRPLRADRGRPAGPAVAPADPRSTLREDPGPDRVDDARVDHARRRHLDARAGRGHHVPAPLALRRPGPARREVGGHRLRRVVPPRVRRALAVGRRGARGAERGAGDGPRTAAVDDHHAARAEGAEAEQGEGRRRAVRARANTATTSRSCSTAWSTSPSAASRSRSSDRARCSASAPREAAGTRTATVTAVTNCRVVRVGARPPRRRGSARARVGPPPRGDRLTAVDRLREAPVGSVLDLMSTGRGRASTESVGA